MFQVMRRNGIPIPIDPKTGKDSCATKLIKSMIETYPLLKEYYEDKRMIDALKNLKLEIGADGRNRFWLNPFGTKTGRNNPSTNRCVLGLPHTMRSFIKPPPGMAIAQVDYGAEEIGIAAALSGDPVLKADYLSGDPYRQFAAAALGILNPTEQQRQVYKATVLGRIYGLGAASLARNLGISKAQAERIIDQMNARYPVLNAWLRRVTTKAAHMRSDRLHPGLVTDRNGTARRGAHVSEFSDASQRQRTDAPRDRARRRERAAADRVRARQFPDRGHHRGDRGLRREAAGRSCARRLATCSAVSSCAPTASRRDIVRYPDRFIDKRELEDGMRHWNRLMALIAEEEDGQFSDHGQGSSVAAAADRGEGEEEEQAAFQGALGEATRAVG